MNDIHTTKQSFLVAAASYFGLPDTQVMQGSAVETAPGGTIDLVLRISLTPDDVMGIAGRMKVMAEMEQPEPGPAPAEMPSRERMREEYNALDKRARSEFGSFARYVAWRGGSDPFAVSEVPPHVYLWHHEATLRQRAEAIGRDAQGRFAVAVDELTEDQRNASVKAGLFVSDPVGAAEQLRAGYVARTVAAHERLNGSDGKPTSNADDFGGVPG